MVKTNEHGALLLKNIITQLKNKGYMLFGTIFSYYSIELDGYLFCAVDPVPSSIEIPISELDGRKLILRGKVDTSIIFEAPQNTTKKRLKKTVTANNKKRTRTKERKIGQVIDQVAVWRRYYNGYTDYQGKLIKLSLDEAAAKVGVPKKSLDD